MRQGERGPARPVGAVGLGWSGTRVALRGRDSAVLGGGGPGAGRALMSEGTVLTPPRPPLPRGPPAQVPVGAGAGPAQPLSPRRRPGVPAAPVVDAGAPRVPRWHHRCLPSRVAKVQLPGSLSSPGGPGAGLACGAGRSPKKAEEGE